MSKNEMTLDHGVTLCGDGKYRWVRSVNLFRNPTFFFLIWKIFFFIALGIFAFMTVLNLFEDGVDGEKLLFNLKIFGIVVGGMTALTLIGYLIYAAIMGGKYIVEFTMDDLGVNHSQVDAQAAKARRIGQAAAIAGMATHNFSAIGAGAAAARTEMYSEFAKVKKIKVYPRRGLIKVNGTLNHNQVYASDADFEFVKNYIISRCPNARVK